MDREKNKVSKIALKLLSYCMETLIMDIEQGAYDVDLMDDGITLPNKTEENEVIKLYKEFKSDIDSTLEHLSESNKEYNIELSVKCFDK